MFGNGNYNKSGHLQVLPMYAARMSNLPPYLFARIDEMKAEQQRKGVDIIDLGVGDPDLPTPDHIVASLCEAAKNPENHHYPSYSGMPAYRGAVADWYKNRFGVSLDFGKEVVALMGSKDGIAHIAEAFVNPGDYVLAPSPGYPVYRTGTLFAEGIVHEMPLTKENTFVPVLDDIPKKVIKSAKLMFINYPNNPTAAVAPEGFYREVVDFAQEHNIVVVSDNAYSEIAYDGYSAPSFLETKGAMEVGIEMHSLSKTYNMTGWRLGVAVGNREMISALGTVKSNYDTGLFAAVQWAGVQALRGDQDYLGEMRAQFQRRRDLFVEGLRRLGFSIEKPKATFYVWGKIPGSLASQKFAHRLLNEAGVVITPGVGFGNCGEGYFRAALTVSEERLEEAIERMRKMVL